MATYLELFDLRINDSLRSRVSVALTVKAAAILALATPTAKQVSWALAAISQANADATAKDYLNYLLAANAGLTVAQFGAVSDASIQSAVSAAVDKVTA